MMKNYTQFGMDVAVKDRLDRFRAMNKDSILVHLGKKKRLVTNSDVVSYLLDTAEAAK